MLKEKMLKALTSQVNAEMYSSYLYLSMESYFQSISLKGFANWMRIQVQEELFHGMKIYDYICECGGRVVLEAIKKPDSDWKSPLAAFKQIQKHEQHVTSLINGLMDLAIAEKDHATQNFLQWFIAEQVEEESSAGEIVDKLKLIKEDTSGLFLLDAELAKRVFVPPTQGA